MVDDLEARLAPGASMLVLVGETSTLDSFVSALGATDDRIMRASLTSEQAEELNKAVGSTA